MDRLLDLPLPHEEYELDRNGHSCDRSEGGSMKAVRKGRGEKSGGPHRRNFGSRAKSAG
jgi:hypothetical protein